MCNKFEAVFKTNKCSADDALYSPVIFSSASYRREILFQSLEDIEKCKDSDELILKKQPGWNTVHKDDVNVMPLWKKIYSLFKPALIVIVISYILFNVVLLHGIVPSESMEPTIMTGECLFSNRLAYVCSEPKRGDIIVFKDIEDEKTLLIKRVIGVAGDTIELYDGNVYINGCQLMEWKYAHGESQRIRNDKTSFVVPENCLFVMGDNREHSKDSRAWSGFISIDDIKGKAMFKYKFEGSIIPTITLLKSENIIFSSDDFAFSEAPYESSVEDSKNPPLLN